MATVLNHSQGGRGVYSLPKRDRDGKPDLTTVKYYFTPMPSPPDKDGNIVPGSCEIPDDVLKELRANDDFTRGLFDSRQWSVDESATPSLVVETDQVAAKGAKATEKK